MATPSVSASIDRAPHAPDEALTLTVNYSDPANTTIEVIVTVADSTGNTTATATINPLTRHISNMPARTWSLVPAPAPAITVKDSYALGVRVEPGPTEFDAYESWLGRSVPIYVTYAGLPGGLTFICNQWAGRSQKLVASLGMVQGVETIQEGAAGAYDARWTSFAEVLVNAGRGDSIIRPGWEMNGGWYAWSARQDPAAYAAYYRRIVDLMRAKSIYFQFDWNVAATGGFRTETEAAYPGDNYVDYIGLDIYDKAPSSEHCSYPARWDRLLNLETGLAWHRDFAGTHGKKMSFPEFGLTSEQPGECAADDPYFIARMADWFHAYDVGYVSYFDVNSENNHALSGGQYPLAADMFRARFG